MTEEMQLFLEDMDEQLSLMEEALLDLNENSLEDVDKELVNKLFRAMHTMKGNAGIFGYDIITEFAHTAESLLDNVRNNKISLSEEMLDLFLLVHDHSQTLIDTSTQDKELDEDQMAIHKNLLSQLSHYLDTNTAPAFGSKQTESKPIQEPQNQQQEYTIKIKLKDEFFVSGMDMLSIIKYLDAIGKVKKVLLKDDDIPPLISLDPLKSYLSIEIHYSTTEPLSEINEAFEFVQDDIELVIEPLEKKEETVSTVKEESNFLVFNKPAKKEKEENVEFKVFKKPKSKKEQNKQETKNKELLGGNFTLKVDSLKVDKLINQISEMVIANAKITQYASNTHDNEFEEAVTVMSEMLEEVRNGIMNIRMVQVGDSLSKLRRIVTDSAKKTGKEIGFEIIGGETELDKTVIEKISDPLVHMLRNSVDHGIEMPELREQNGKTRKGTVLLKAYPDSGSIVIEIFDDGRGLDKKKLFEKAVEKNLIKPDENLSDEEILNLIFMPGLSTAKEVSDLSGRGVGMDVVKRNIQDLRGTIDIQSTLGVGTTFTIRLPLTLAIIDGFLVQVGHSKYIVPLDNIQECIELDAKAKEQMKTKGYITLRSNILPILDIADYFKEEKVKSTRQNVVIVQYGKSQVGLKVDELFGEFQTVIKPLGDLFKNISGISGGTILGNGEVALIFDVQKLIEYKITHKEGQNGN